MEADGPPTSPPFLFLEARDRVRGLDITLNADVEIALVVVGASYGNDTLIGVNEDQAMIQMSA